MITAPILLLGKVVYFNSVLMSSLLEARQLERSIQALNSMAIHSLGLDLMAAVVGLVVGSFLNVLSLRTLSGESILWPPSHCQHCRKSLLLWDNIPIVSYLLLKGRCRYCQALISWQYPAVEAATAVSFFVLVELFGATWQAAGMAVFVSTLIAVTVTDLREKLIPHDITYPSLLVGIGFSSFVRNDLLGAMAGIGVSYILFDFLAHYGLKLYLRYHLPQVAAADDNDNASTSSLQPDVVEEVEEIEVMGGGDAVLSAVIAAYLGWQRLLAALLVGFLIGTIAGVVLLIVEMRKAGILGQVVRPALAGVILGFSALGLTTLVLSAACGLPFLPWLQFGLLGAAGGGLIGVVSIGTRVSKPFPFGPALAAGGVTAIFWNPLGCLLGSGA